MRNERRTILGLVAAGRISAMEAERLLRVWNDAREELWIIAACLLLCVTQVHFHFGWDGEARCIENLAREAFRTWSAGLSQLMEGLGGTL